MPEIDVPAEDVNIQQLADIFLFVITAQVAVLELLPNVRKFLVYSLLFQVSCSRISKVGDELNKTAHVRVRGVGPAEEAGGSGGSHVVEKVVVSCRIVSYRMVSCGSGGWYIGR